MRRTILNVWFVAAACVLWGGCSEKVQVGGGFVLVTPRTIGPDHHPGTSLNLKGKLVWGNVYVGYFNGRQPYEFYRDGMFVFVGAVPGSNDWWYYPQLFAVRGSGPPVILSERLLGEPFAVSYDTRQYSSLYAVDNISPSENGVRVQFTHSAGTVNHDTNSVTLPWPVIGQLLDEADSSSRLVRHRFGDYRVLALNQK